MWETITVEGNRYLPAEVSAFQCLGKTVVLYGPLSFGEGKGSLSSGLDDEILFHQRPAKHMLCPLQKEEVGECQLPLSWGTVALALAPA